MPEVDVDQTEVKHDGTVWISSSLEDIALLVALSVEHGGVYGREGDFVQFCPLGC